MWSAQRNRFTFSWPAKNALPVCADRIAGAVTRSVAWVATSSERLRSRQFVLARRGRRLRSKSMTGWIKPRSILPTADAAVDGRKAQSQQLLVLASSSLAFSTLGTIGVPVFFWLGGGLLAVLAMPVCLRGLRDLSKANININVLYLVVMGGMLITGNLWAGSFSMVVYALAERLTLLVTGASRQSASAASRVHHDFVYVLCDGATIQRPFNELQVGDIVAVHASDTIPVDGRVVAGTATVDQHVLTGETQPVETAAGQPVYATTVLLSGWLHIEVEKTGDETAMARVGQTLIHATDFKSTVQMRSQELSDRSVLPTLLLGAACLPMLGVSGALAVISTHFKARMNVTAPLSALNYLKKSSKQGILFKDGRSLDWLHDIDTVVFAQGGILTCEEPVLQQILVFIPDVTEQMILQYAASAQASQDHALARAILYAAQQHGVALLPLDEAELQTGCGLRVLIQNQVVRVGSVRFMETEQLPITPAAAQCVQQAAEQAHTLILVAVDQVILGGIALAESLRPEARQVVSELRQLPQIKAIYLLASDTETSTRRLADALGIACYVAEALPQRKAEWIEQMQKEGKSICYIDDGFTDSLALYEAKVSVVLHSTSTVEMDRAQIVLMDGQLTQLPMLFKIARSFRNDTNVMFGVTVAPMLVGMASIFLLQYGVIQVVLLNKVSLAAATGIAMLPLWRSFPGRSPNTDPSAD